MNDISVVDGVKIITDENGNQHFEFVDDTEEKQSKPITEEVDNRRWWQKVKDWLFDHEAQPYVKVRDLANPFGDRDDIDAGSDGVHGIEAGIKIKF